LDIGAGTVELRGVMQLTIEGNNRHKRGGQSHLNNMEKHCWAGESGGARSAKKKVVRAKENVKTTNEAKKWATVEILETIRCPMKKGVGGSVGKFELLGGGTKKVSLQC